MTVLCAFVLFVVVVVVVVVFFRWTSLQPSQTVEA